MHHATIADYRSVVKELEALSPTSIEAAPVKLGPYHFFSGVLVDVETGKYIISKYPGLLQSPFFANLFIYLATGGINLGGDRMAVLAGHLNGHNFVAETALKAFVRHTGIQLRYTDYQYKEGLARGVLIDKHDKALTGIPDEVVGRVKTGIVRAANTGGDFIPVIPTSFMAGLPKKAKGFITNSADGITILKHARDVDSFREFVHNERLRFTNKKIKQHTKAFGELTDRQEFLLGITNRPYHEVAHHAEHITSRIGSRITELIAAMDDADGDERTRLSNRIVKLAALHINPFAVLRPAGNSFRLFHSCEMINSEDRDYVYDNYIQLDLSFCHLAAMLWIGNNIESVSARQLSSYVRPGDDPYLLIASEIEEASGYVYTRGQIKAALNPFLFTAGDATTFREFEPEAPELFRLSTTFRLLSQMRADLLSYTQQHSGIETMGGAWVQTLGKSKKTKARKPAAVLHMACSAVELDLVTTALEATPSHLVCYLFDGIIIDAEGDAIQDIIYAVATRAEEIGVLTRMEVS